MLKVLVTGAFSTGKTTLVNALQQALASHQVSTVILSDVARDSPVLLNQHQTELGSLWLLSTQVSREIAAELGTEQVLLCDRGVPDILAHHEEVRERLEDHHVSLMRPFLDNWMLTYDMILFSRIDESRPIAADIVRVSEPSFRAKMQLLSEKILQNLRTVRNLPNDSNKRLNYALGAILDKLNLRR